MLLTKLSKASPEEAEAAVRLLLKRRSWHTGMVLPTAITRWAEQSPAEALNLIKGEATKDSQKASFISYALQGHAKKNWMTAWNSAQREAEWLSGLRGDGIAEISTAEHLKAITTSMISALANSLQPQDAVDLAQQIEQDELRVHAHGKVFSHLASRHPEQMEQLYFQLAADARLKVSEDLIKNISWTPNVSADWIKENVPPNHRERLFKITYEKWLKQNASAAAAWLDNNLETPGIDGALDVLITKFRGSHPDLALQWAELLSSEQARKNKRKEIRRIAEKKQKAS